MPRSHPGTLLGAGHVPRWCALFLLCLAAWWPGLSRAVDREPVTVDVGLFLNSIPTVMLKERKFQADFNVWFRWTGDDVNPLEGFEVVDGHFDAKEELVKKKIDKVNYALYKIVATIHNNFDLSKYPLDDHALKIQIEDTKLDSHAMRYRADSANSNFSERVHVPGWDVGHVATAVAQMAYPTNFGDASAAHAGPSGYSRFTFTVDLHRNGYGNFFKLFSMLFFAGLLSFFAFRVRADHLDARLALIVSGIFMAAITANMIASTLPESDTLDMAEKLYFNTMGFIFVTCLASVHTFRLFLQSQEARANSLSRRLGQVLPVLYVVANTLIVTLAHNEI